MKSSFLTRSPLHGLAAVFFFLPLFVQAQIVPIADDVLVDRDADRVLLQANGGALQALSTETGVAAWSNPTLARPVGLLPPYVVAQRADSPVPGVLALAIADAASGEVLQPIDIPLAAGVVPLLEDGPAARFQLYVVHAGPVMTLEWTWDRSPLRGAQLAATETAVAIRTTEREFGRFELELASGAVTPVPIAEPLERPPRFEEVVLIGGAPGRQFSEPSGALVLASELDTPDAWDRYAWRLYALDGTLLGGLRSQWSLAPFSVTGSAVLVIEPPHSCEMMDKRTSRDLSLVGYDLDTGIERWRAPLRDRTYRGPLPS